MLWRITNTSGHYEYIVPEEIHEITYGVDCFWIYMVGGGLKIGTRIETDW